ncbi:hypothetical protein A6J64_021925 [Yersinia enterocolitica]|uniref:head completion/stabilization protein n=1 Tax=Yersinia enterocolitica TaxID=630 RepID=UPI0009F1D4F4|nr:head completion/stabilization protein [Yersinia enterocolitica]PNM14430.1 hypothetical protein A6J64_021925 [Yersinia enterocolitica]
MAAGFKALAEVQAEQMDGENMQLAEYLRAVGAVTAALLADVIAVMTPVPVVISALKLSKIAGEWWRDARHSIRNITGQPHNIIDLI